MKKNKNQTIKSKKAKKQYPSHYLAIILAAVLILEGVMICMTTSSDWHDASSILDVTVGLNETISDTVTFFQPVTDVVSGVSEFYKQATDQMMTLLDLSGSFSDLTEVFNGVGEFYTQASIQMAHLLDVSETPAWGGKLSGASITIGQ
jgi:hypothetical protein